MLDRAGLTELQTALEALATPGSALVPEALAPLASLARQGADVTIDMAASRTLGAPLVVVRPAPSLDLSRLTPRQREVAALVAEGLSNKDIARALDLSLSTVKDHVHAILARLSLPRRAALIAAARTRP